MFFTSPKFLPFLFGVIRVVFRAISKLIRRLWIPILLLIGLFPVITLFFTYILPNISTWLPNAFTFLKGAIEITKTIANAIVGPMNIAVMIIKPLAAGIRDAFYFIGSFLVIIWNAIGCTSPLTGDITVDCPLVGNILTFIISNLYLIPAFFGFLGQLISNVYYLIGMIVCPNGVCSGDLCSNTATCPYTPFTLLGVILSAASWFFSVFWWILALVFGFLVDMAAFGAYIFGYALTGNFGQLENAINQRIVPQITITTQNPKPELFVLQNTLNAIETFIIDTTLQIVLALRWGIILLDTLLCNIFRDFKNCAASKVCYFFQTAKVCVPGSTVLCIPLNFIGDICHNWFLFSRGVCQCDQTVFATNDFASTALKSLSDQTPYNCAPVTPNQDLINQFKQHIDGNICKRITYDSNGLTVISSTPLNTWCMCSGTNTLSNPSSLPVLYYPTGIWVPCVPGQAPCSCKYSLIPAITFQCPNQ